MKKKIKVNLKKFNNMRREIIKKSIERDPRETTEAEVLTEITSVMELKVKKVEKEEAVEEVVTEEATEVEVETEVATNKETQMLMKMDSNWFKKSKSSPREVAEEEEEAVAAEEVVEEEIDLTLKVAPTDQEEAEERDLLVNKNNNMRALLKNE